MPVQYEGERPKGPLKRRFARLLAFLFIVGFVLAGVIGLLAYGYYAQDLPHFDSLADYKPPLTTEIYAQDGQQIGEIFAERRELLPYERIPPKLVQAFLVSEDAGFFDHSGIDFLGILRAAIANLRAGRVVQGGSTITQQVAKSLLISQEGFKEGTAKKLGRKIKEAILARRLEKDLTKQDILTLYLNQIFLGNQAYGVQAAAQNYFHKDAAQLNVAEIALIAGLPQAPSRYSPFRHPKRAKDRREYVLRRMLEEEIITEAELNEAKELPIRVFHARELSKEVAPYFTEQVRRELFSRYDKDTLLKKGLRVWTSVDVERYRAAEDAAYEKLRMVDRRQGFQGPLAHFSGKKKRAEFIERYKAELKHQGRDGPLRDGELYLALVTRVDKEKRHVHLQIGPHKAVLPLAAMRWARPENPQRRFDSSLLTRLPKNIKRGDVLLVRTIATDKLKKDGLAKTMSKNIPDGVQLVKLEQEPKLETALLSVDVHSGYVLAMLGGYSFDRSEFNRALQSCRQPGSSFKPIVYSAALELKGWTPATTVLDAPVAFNDPANRKRWKPGNFASKFLGEVTLRMALQRSMNVPAVRVLDGVGLRRAIRWAHKLGISSKLRPELGLALGSSCVKMGDLVNVYQLFANYGRRIPRRFITRIEDNQGRLLFDDGYPRDPWAGIGEKMNRAEAWLAEDHPQVIRETTGFLITKMMRNVVQGGTGTGAREVGVPVAGKTGTTNDSFDAWFVGFTPDIATAVWVGYDDYVSPMGRYEQGGRAALPVWVAYMKKAIKVKTKDFVAPAGITYANIDAKTGERVPAGTPGSVMEAFKAGTAPKASERKLGEEKPDEFFLLDH